MGLFLKILLQVLAFAVAILIALLDYWRPDRRTKVNRRIRRSFLVAAVALLAISIFVTVKDDKDNDRKERELRTQLSTVTEQNKGLQNGIAVLSDTVTSQESFCFVIAGVINSKLIFQLWTERKNPVYDVTVYILDDSNKTEYPLLQASANGHYLGTVGFFPRIVHQQNLGTDTAPKRWFIILDTRYHTYVEDLRLAKVDGEWLLAFQLFDTTEQLKSFYTFAIKGEGSILDVAEPSRKVVKEYFDDGFPRNEIEKKPFSSDFDE